VSGVAVCHPRPLGVAARHPLRPPQWLGAAQPPFQLFFFEFLFIF
jgi:hypothetical protein